VVLFVAGSYALRDSARASATALDGVAAHRVIDLIASPRTGNPLCWNVLALDESGDSIYLRRGTIAVGLSMLPINPCGRAPGNAFDPGEVQPLADLRAVMRADCRVRAWLQFGRAPLMRDGWIADARFGGKGAGNFNAMQVAGDRSTHDCPPHLTDWDLPRADVLQRPDSPP